MFVGLYCIVLGSCFFHARVGPLHVSLIEYSLSLQQRAFLEEKQQPVRLAVLCNANRERR